MTEYDIELANVRRNSTTRLELCSALELVPPYNLQKYHVLSNNNRFSFFFQVRFAYSRRLAGVMLWTLDLDDFLGTYCNSGEFPLVTAVYDAIQELKPTSANQVVTMTTQSTKPTTPIDFRLHHKTNKNGINFFIERTNGVSSMARNNLVAMFAALLLSVSFLTKISCF